MSDADRQVQCGSGSVDEVEEPPSSPRSRRRAMFPDATDAQWNDWRWQLRNRIRDLKGLARILPPTPDEARAAAVAGGRLPLGITPYYATLIDPNDPNDPVRRTAVPLSGELEVGPGEVIDPLNEDGDSVVPGLVHRYPDRVLFLVTNFCAVYCRYCTRARLVGHTGEFHFDLAQHQRAIDYIAANPQVRDVLISGGDPLTMADDKLEGLLAALRAIPHVEFLRIGTKVPAVLPQRITPAFVEMLKRYHPLFMSIHFMHPAELTPEVQEATARLADAGVPMGSQTVLTRGVNDDPWVMKKLMQGLLRFRVKPYYLYQCDPIVGSSHLRTTVQEGLDIIAQLRGHTTGYAVPAFVVDAPGGGGKIQLLPESVVGREPGALLLRNFEGQVFRYPEAK
jgi:lysine 2,3-aminomutase